MVRLKISNNLIISEITEVGFTKPEISSVARQLNEVASTVDTRITTFKGKNAFTSYHNGLRCDWVDNVPAIPDLKNNHRVYFFTKRLFDITAASLALIALSPLFLFIALSLKLFEKEPVFFKQERVGYQNRIFKMYKFRTMHHHRCDASGVEQTQIDDERVTKFGRFLRKTSIDELPQLINILRGEMSLVGPRPFVKGQLATGKPYKEVVPYYDLRHLVVPGLTGWSQANGYRGQTDKKNRAIGRIENDMAYIQNMSIWLDIKIIFLTIKNEFFTGSGH